MRTGGEGRKKRGEEKREGEEEREGRGKGEEEKERRRRGGGRVKEVDTLKDLKVLSCNVRLTESKSVCKAASICPIPERSLSSVESFPGTLPSRGTQHCSARLSVARISATTPLISSPGRRESNQSTHVHSDVATYQPCSQVSTTAMDVFSMNSATCTASGNSCSELGMSLWQ